MAVAIAIKVRFFARLRELTGKETDALKAAPDARIIDVYEAMRVAYTALPSHETVSAALNREFADWDAPVADGDEVAFIPPVSGGA